MKEISMEQINDRGITRLCHFTKSKNIPYILGELNGILSTETIPLQIREVNDVNRFDKRLDYICCSLEYPNIYYLDKIRDNDKLFKEWVILAIDPSIIVDRECLFSPVNAATESGKYIKGGRIGFSQLYSNNVITKKRNIIRSSRALKSCPTDIQAEVLIKDEIPKEYIQSIIVENEDQGRIQKIKLKYLNLESQINVIVAPELFQKEQYSKIKEGIRLREYPL